MVVPAPDPYVGPATVNRKLAVVTAFYEHHRRHGVEVADLLTRWQVGGGGEAPFLKWRL